MALTKQDVAKLADLARIDLTDDELTLMAGQLDVVLEAIATVSQVAGPDVPPTSHAFDLTNVFRPDEVKPSLPQDVVMAMAPAHEDGRVKVPQILVDPS